MKDFLLTFKFLLKQSLSLSYFLNLLKFDKKKRNMAIVIIIAIMMSLPSYIMFIYSFVKMYDIFASLNQASFFLVIAILFSMIIILLFGLYQIIAYFYFSNEVKILMPMPIKTSHILISKFFVIYMIELLISVFTVLPFFLIYGIKSGIDIISWVYLSISFILIPIIPIVILVILTIVLMKLTHAFKYKDALRVIGMVIILVAALGFQFTLNKLIFSITPGGEQEYIEQLLNNNQFFVDKIVVYYPVISLVVNAVEADLLKASLSVLILLLVSILSILLFSMILEKIFLNSYLKEQENTTTKRSKKVNFNRNQSSSPAFAISKVDFITLLKVPIYLFNCLSTIIIIPILLFIMPLAYGQDNINQTLNIYYDNKNITWYFIILGLAIFSTFNQIAPTTFSREGKTNWIMRTLPISAKDHILGRFYTAFFTQLAFILITVSLFMLNIRQDYLLGLFAIILSCLASVPLIFIGIYIDLKRPLLKWDNPQQAVKQNLNGLISMAVGLLYGFLMALIYIGLNKYISFELLLGLYALINLLLVYLTYHYLNKQFEESLVLMD
jgi:ABC-2 type transport system permease protein